MLKIIGNIIIIVLMGLAFMWVLGVGLDRECHRVECEETHWKLQGYPIGEQDGN